MENDKLLFDDYKISDLLKEIKTRSDTKYAQLEALVSDVKNLIKDKNDAMMLFPHIKEFLTVGVKNDEQLVKLASIIQKLIVIKEADGGDGGLSDDEKKQLLESLDRELQDVKQDIKVPVSSFSAANKK